MFLISLSLLMMFLLPEVLKPFLCSWTHLWTGLLDTHSSFKLCWLHLFLEGHDLCPIPVAHLIAVLPAPHVKLAAGGTSLLCCPGAVSKVTGGSCAPQACPHGEINSPGGDSGSVCGWMPSLPILWQSSVEACSTWFFRERETPEHLGPHCPQPLLTKHPVLAFFFPISPSLLLCACFLDFCCLHPSLCLGLTQIRTPSWLCLSFSWELP